MERIVRLWSFLLLVMLFSSDFSVSADLSGISPAPSPGIAKHSPISPSPANNRAPAPTPDLRNPSPEMHSPPVPPSGPSPSQSPLIAPSVLVASDSTSHAEKEGSSNGMKGGQKAGIAIGVVVGAGLVGLGAFVYKKRQDNIRRTQYSYAARRELL